MFVPGGYPITSAAGRWAGGRSVVVNLFGSHSGGGRGQRFELQLAEHAGSGATCPAQPRGQRVEIHLKRHRGVDRDQVLGEERGLPVGDKFLAETLLGDLPSGTVQLFHAPVLLYQGDRGLLADTRDPGNVVGFVSDEPEDVDNPVGRDAKFLPDPLLLDELQVAALPGLYILILGEINCMKSLSPVTNM